MQIAKYISRIEVYLLECKYIESNVNLLNTQCSFLICERSCGMTLYL